ncbi:MAG: hypothetical protein AAGE52_39635, partial [Myxococcota bacterium]
MLSRTSSHLRLPFLCTLLLACGGGSASRLSTLSGTFQGPESAHWDANRGVWFVSNFGQNLDLSGATPDQPAYLSRLGPGGDVQEERVIEIDG